MAKVAGESELLDALPNSYPGAPLGKVVEFLGGGDPVKVRDKLLRLYRRGAVVAYTDKRGVERFYALDMAWIRDRAKLNALKARHDAKVAAILHGGAPP